MMVLLGLNSVVELAVLTVVAYHCTGRPNKSVGDNWFTSVDSNTSHSPILVSAGQPTVSNNRKNPPTYCRTSLAFAPGFMNVLLVTYLGDEGDKEIYGA